MNEKKKAELRDSNDISENTDIEEVVEKLEQFILFFRLYVNCANYTKR